MWLILFKDKILTNITTSNSCLYRNLYNSLNQQHKSETNLERFTSYSPKQILRNPDSFITKVLTNIEFYLFYLYFFPFPFFFFSPFPYCCGKKRESIYQFTIFPKFNN